MNSGADGERDVSRARYKAAEKVAKKAVAVAKSLAFDRLYHIWGPRKGRRMSLSWRGLEKEEQGI